MKLNNKGYSMVELFAVILIASVIIFPLMSTLVNNIEINYRLHNRRAALSISETTLVGFNRIDFAYIESMVITENDNFNYYVEIDGSNCATELGIFGIDADDDITLCEYLFNDATWNSISFQPDSYKAYLFDFNLTQAKHDYLTNPANGLPQKLIDEINQMTPTDTPNPGLYYIYVWIQYGEDDIDSFLLGGVVTNE